MKLATLMLGVMICLLVGGCEKKTDNQNRRNKNIDVQIEALRKEIIPSQNTPQAEVEKVFGKGKKVDYQYLPKKLHNATAFSYDLLFDDKENRTAFLFVEYSDSKVFRASINHLCVAKGRVYNAPGSEMAKKQAEEIRKENELQLLDLKAIRQKYLNKLEKSSWR